MKAFVTGATGFVGSHLVRALRARGDVVTCLARTPARAEGLDGVRVVLGDLADSAALAEGCAEADVVYHVGGAIRARSMAEFLAINHAGTANLVAAAAAVPPRRFVYVSSIAVGGPTVAGAPIDEARPPAPVTDYGRSKLAGEEAVRASTLAWTVVRPPVVYGEGDRETLRIFRFARLGVGPVVGDGNQELSLIHVEDLAGALVAAATTAATVGRTYYAAHPAITTSAGFFAAAGRALGRTPRLVRIPGVLARGALWAVGSVAHLTGSATVLTADKANEFLAPAWTCRVDALRRDAGWEARIDLDAGTRRAAAWYRKEGWL